jgi:hypothetical protein
VLCLRTVFRRRTTASSQVTAGEKLLSNEHHLSVHILGAQHVASVQLTPIVHWTVLDGSKLLSEHWMLAVVQLCGGTDSQHTSVQSPGLLQGHMRIIAFACHMRQTMTKPVERVRIGQDLWQP